MDVLFQISPYQVSPLLHQVSIALESRTEFISRRKYPQIWKITDHLNAQEVSVVASKKRHTRHQIYGVLLTIMGIFCSFQG